MAPRSRPRTPAARSGRALALAAAAALLWRAPTRADEGSTPMPGVVAEPVAAEPAAARPTPAPTQVDIKEFRVEGSRALPAAEVERALAPFLGRGKMLQDVEAARAALEKAYTDAGFQTVLVAIPRQKVQDGVVVLDATEGKVDRLRVHGARWFLPSDVKALAPSVAEGSVPNLQDVVRDITALNQLPDRRVTPAIHPGTVPGTIGVDLNVEDTLPLHGSLELNNRHGAQTLPVRLLGSVRYANLWQAGHTLGFSFQVAPQSKTGKPAGVVSFRKTDPDARVVMATYLARFDDPGWLSLSASASYQDGKVVSGSGADSVAIQSSGKTAGLTASFTLPGEGKLFHSVTTGLEYKRFGQDLILNDGKARIALPITYAPASLQYTLVLSGDHAQTQVDAGAILNLAPLSSDQTRFDDRRSYSSPTFFYLRGGLTRTDELGRFRTAVKAQWQLSWDPLIPSEQFSAGGADSVRGYLDSTAVGDLGASLSLELQSPSLWKGAFFKDLRFIVFTEGAWAGLRQPLPEVKDSFWLASAGVGVRLRLRGMVGELDVGFPFTDAGRSPPLSPTAHFRLATEF